MKMRIAGNREKRKLYKRILRKNFLSFLQLVKNETTNRARNVQSEERDLFLCVLKAY